MYLDLSMVADGYTAFEHSLAVAPLYRDVVELIARTGTYYTPTLLVAYGGPTAEAFFYAADNHHDDAKLRRFVPEDVLDNHRRRVVIPEDEYHFPRVASGAAAAAATLSGCLRRPAEHILPYTRTPEYALPGIGIHFTSVLSHYGEATGVMSPCSTVAN